MSTKDTLENVVKEGISQGQAEAGQPVIPLTKKDRETVGAQIVAAWYVKLVHFLMFKGWK
jgi:hypothetical protein